MDNFILSLKVAGQPVPKQSFRVTTVHGHTSGFTDPRMQAWQQLVGSLAKQAMAGRAPTVLPLKVWVEFSLTDRRRVDLDNLNKGTVDACNGIIWKDDTQIVELHLSKQVKPGQPGIEMKVFEVKSVSTETGGKA